MIFFRCNGEESLDTKICLLKKQTTDVNRTTKVCLTQKNLEKKTGLQPEKLRNLKDSNRNPDFKKKPTYLKTSLKCGRIISTSKIFENNIKSSDKNKFTACKANLKSNPANKGITKTINKNINTNSKKTLSSFETKTISDSVEDKKENLPSPINYSSEQEVCTPQRNPIAPKQDCFPASKCTITKICSEIFMCFLLNVKINLLFCVIVWFCR